MMESPFTGLGRLQQEVQSLERTVQGKADNHTVRALESLLRQEKAEVRNLAQEVFNQSQEIQATRVNPEEIRQRLLDSGLW